ncbi:MAG: hypothetical protein MUF49_01465 [Oculatellaceae cyanobacterium Prado106]|nr:hypothetical protein [Oculatellaceae cyanobacterium Prado106]
MPSLPLAGHPNLLNPQALILKPAYLAHCDRPDCPSRSADQRYRVDAWNARTKDTRNEPKSIRNQWKGLMLILFEQLGKTLCAQKHHFSPLSSQARMTNHKSQTPAYQGWDGSSLLSYLESGR